LAASPKKSIASASSETEPEVQPAPISVTNIAALTISAIHNARRTCGSVVGA
jgi:hypothetical protein